MVCGVEQVEREHQVRELGPNTHGGARECASPRSPLSMETSTGPWPCGWRPRVKDRIHPFTDSLSKSFIEFLLPLWVRTVVQNLGCTWRVIETLEKFKKNPEN